MTLEVNTGVASMADVRAEIVALLTLKGWTNPAGSVYASPSATAAKQFVRIAPVLAGAGASWAGVDFLRFRFGTGNSGDSITGGPEFPQKVGGVDNDFGCGLISNYINAASFPATLKLYYFPSEFMIAGVIVSDDIAQHFSFGEMDTTIDQVARIGFYHMPSGSHKSFATYGGMPLPKITTNYRATLQGSDYFNGQACVCGPSGEGKGSSSGLSYRCSGYNVGLVVEAAIGEGQDNSISDGWVGGGLDGQDGTINGSKYSLKYGNNVKALADRFNTPFLQPQPVIHKHPVGNLYAGTFLQIGMIPNLRYMLVTKMAMAEDFRLGSDIWTSYPAFKKNTAETNGTSGRWGMAIYKELA